MIVCLNHFCFKELVSPRKALHVMGFDDDAQSTGKRRGSSTIAKLHKVRKYYCKKKKIKYLKKMGAGLRRFTTSSSQAATERKVLIFFLCYNIYIFFFKKRVRSVQVELR
jgi:hypothetical protein